MSSRIRDSVALTVQIHRFEVVFSFLALALLTLVLVAFIAQVASVAVPAGCEPGMQEDACRGPLVEFRRAVAATDLARGPLPLILLTGVALVLGIPLVAREIETGSALLPWSLSARRSRWLRQRLLPMLALLLAGLILVAALGAVLRDVSTLVARPPELDDLQDSALILVATGFMAFGVATFLGAAIGRLFPAVVLAVVLLTPAIFGAPIAQDRIAQQAAQTWVEPYDAASESFVDTGATLEVISVGYRSDDHYSQGLSFRQELAGPGADLAAWTEANVVRVREVVPLEVYQLIEWGWALGSVLVGLLALAGTRLAVDRRRPI